MSRGFAAPDPFQKPAVSERRSGRQTFETPIENGLPEVAFLKTALAENTQTVWVWVGRLLSNLAIFVDRRGAAPILVPLVPSIDFAYVMKLLFCSPSSDNRSLGDVMIIKLMGFAVPLLVRARPSCSQALPMLTDNLHVAVDQVPPGKQKLARGSWLDLARGPDGDQVFLCLACEAACPGSFTTTTPKLCNFTRHQKGKSHKANVLTMLEISRGPSGTASEIIRLVSAPREIA